MTPDPKPPARIRDPELMRELALASRECCLADYAYDECEPYLSRHHIHRHPRDDVRANIAVVCGSGTTGHHGKLEAHDAATEKALGDYLFHERPDTVAYLRGKIGHAATIDWLKRIRGRRAKVA